VSSWSSPGLVLGYFAMSTGVVDMVALPSTSLLPPFRLAEIAKSTSFGISGLYNPCG